MNIQTVQNSMRTFRFLFLALFIANTSPASAVESAAGAATVDAVASLSPEQEATLKTFVKQAADAKRILWVELMKGELGAVRMWTGLDEKRLKSLESAIGPVIDEALKAWAAKLEAQYRKLIEESPGMLLGSNFGLGKGFANGMTFLGCDGPVQHPAWGQALAKNLTTEELAHLTQDQAASKQVIEKEIEGYLEAWGVQFKLDISRSLLQEVADLKRDLNLSDERAAKLDALAEAAVEQSMELWRSGVSKSLRSVDQSFRDNIQRTGQTPYLLMEAKDRPEEQAIWKEGLGKLLTPEEWVLTASLKVKRVEAEQKELTEILNPQTAKLREQLTGRMLKRVGDLELDLKLTKDRVAQLESVANAAVEQSIEAFVRRVKAFLMRYSLEQRKQILNQAGVPFLSTFAGLPERQAAWINGLVELLSADEIIRMQASERLLQSWRVKMLGKLMVSYMDSRIALSASQRQLLEPIAENLILLDPALVPVDSGNDYDRYTEQRFFTIGAKAPESELMSILGLNQLKWWKGVKGDGNGQSVADDDDEELEVADQEGAVEGAAGSELEEVETAISSFMEKKAARHRQRALEKTMFKVEDINRSAKVSADTATRLQTMARGVVERELVPWKSELEEIVRSNMQRPNLANVARQLAAIPDHIFSQNQGRFSEKKASFDTAIRAELTVPELSAWEQALGERQAYQDAAVCGLLLVELDRLVGLRASQRDGLEPILTAMLKDYAPDIQGMFTQEGGTAWFSVGYLTYIPLVGVPEDKMKAVLTEAQWKQLIDSNQYTQAANYWRNIKTVHEQRLRSQKR